MGLLYMCVAKTKVLISCAITAQLICAFVFAHAKKNRYSRDAAHFTVSNIRYVGFRGQLFVFLQLNLARFTNWLFQPCTLPNL